MALYGALFVAAILSTGERTASNGIGIELLGSAGAFSVSYERFVGDRVSLRLGLGRSGFDLGEREVAVPAGVSS